MAATYLSYLRIQTYYDKGYIASHMYRTPYAYV